MMGTGQEAHSSPWRQKAAEIFSLSCSRSVILGDGVNSRPLGSTARPMTARRGASRDLEESERSQINNSFKNSGMLVCVSCCRSSHHMYQLLICSPAHIHITESLSDSSDVDGWCNRNRWLMAAVFKISMETTKPLSLQRTKWLDTLTLSSILNTRTCIPMCKTNSPDTILQGHRAASWVFPGDYDLFKD